MKFPTIKQLFEDIMKKENMKDRVMSGEENIPDKEDNVYKKPSTGDISPGGQFAQGI